MEPKIIEKPEFKIVGLEITTTVQECMGDKQRITQLWKNFMSRLGEIKNQVNGKVHYGYSITISKKECSFRHIACVEVSEFEDVPEDMVKETVPASKYAVWTHKGDIKRIGETYGRLYEKDMPESGLMQKEFWFELYDDRFNENTEDSECDIYVAVE
ncbi:GyrI-like domain-containing protein [Nanoarchaeota archaeon]